MQNEIHPAPVWKAGDLVPPGTYVRIDDESYRKVKLHHAGPLPASFDGHVAFYRAAATIPRFHGHALVGVVQEASGNNKQAQESLG